MAVGTAMTCYSIIDIMNFGIGIGSNFGTGTPWTNEGEIMRWDIYNFFASEQCSMDVLMIVIEKM